MTVEMIVACARNGVIGQDNKMLWHVPEDFAHFKQQTMGCPIVMGRKTWESIGRPLPGRKNVVITRQRDYVAGGASVVSSLQEALRLLEGEDKVFVIGGGEIYRQAMPLASRLWVTVMDRDYEGDTTFPTIDESRFADTVIRTLEPTEKRPFKVIFHRWDRR